MVGEASRAIENISASLEFKMHALKNCLLKNAFFFGPSLGPPALALARRPWPWPAGPSLGYASAEASGPRPGPLGLGRCLRKAFFSAHFSKAGLLILERQNIYSKILIISRSFIHYEVFLTGNWDTCAFIWVELTKILYDRFVHF